MRVVSLSAIAAGLFLAACSGESNADAGAAKSDARTKGYIVCVSGDSEGSKLFVSSPKPTEKDALDMMRNDDVTPAFVAYLAQEHAPGQVDYTPYCKHESDKKSAEAFQAQMMERGTSNGFEIVKVKFAPAN